MKFNSVNQVKLNFTCETSALSIAGAALLTEKALNMLQVFHGYVLSGQLISCSLAVI